jgi:histidinol dehydrogenase
MILPITVADGKQEKALFARQAARGGEASETITQTVREILAAVKTRGDAAVLEYTRKFDGADAVVREVSPTEIAQAGKTLDAGLIAAMETAAENIRTFHARQVRQSFVQFGQNGEVLGQRILPLHRVGIYVPGGTAPLFSSVLMNAIPAKIAGVQDLIMVTPSPKSKQATALMLAAAKIAGVDRLFFAGGAQAIAAIAYGTETIPKVDKIVGPGNIFVATAKKMLFGVVDIDSIAGPSEILVVADETANPAWLAADLLSQAEHDKLAGAILLCTSREILEATAQELETQIAVLPRKEIAEEALKTYGGLVLCGDLEQAVSLANIIAPEHLELCVQEPFFWLGKIQNAGSVFLGHYTPEPLGDYFAGANHVLPTGGTARFFSPLSVDDFVKKSQFLSYSKSGLSDVTMSVQAMAHAEGLDAHANAAAIRGRGACG